MMPANPAISIRGLKKIFPSGHGPVQAVNNIDLDVTENEFVVLLGPSGCGKTTTLRCVAGLERPDGGSIEIAGDVVNSFESGRFVPPERRDIGMVFQSYAVWPHLNVYQNVALPLTDGRTRLPKSQIRDRVMECLGLVRMNGLENRPVTDLSGGQQQRVALARAIVTRPKVLLMDEPLSNLDARLREEMRLELKKIAGSVGVTSLYVTHDQAEALSLGDKICVMKDGEIQQIGSPQDVYSRPPNQFVAEFVGEMNFIKGRVTGPGQVESPLGLRSYDLPPECRIGSAVTLAIRPHHLNLSNRPDGNSGCPQGTVVSKTYLGETALIELELSGVTLHVRVSGDSAFAVGQRASLILPAGHWHIYA
jgi:iron(III) transport system ATP-binding protein